MRKLIASLAIVVASIFGAGTATHVQPVAAVSPYLACTYSPASSSRTTYGQAICFIHNKIGPASFRLRITCQYFLGLNYTTYNVYSGWKAADAGIWAYAVCPNHGFKSDRYSAPGTPDIVIHSWVEYSGGGITWVNGGF